jgi:hypothetical protein
VTILGASGHQDIPVQALDYVTTKVDDVVRTAARPLEGISSLAIGADQLFARSILKHGGALHVVVPSRGYEDTFKTPDERTSYEQLLRAANDVARLPYSSPSEEAYLAAGRSVVDRSDRLIAVWDGADARGKGGTADIVRYAQRQGIPVEVIWPDGVSRG